MENNNQHEKIKNTIRQNCPVLTETLTTDTALETDHLEPRELGADNTRRLFTYVYGMDLNGYSHKDILHSANTIFEIELSLDDINSMINYIDFETRIASMQHTSLRAKN